MIDGPFTETKELVAGFWLIQVKSKAEAIEWAKRVPFDDGEIEVRQVFELEDFGAERGGRASRAAQGQAGEEVAAGLPASGRRWCDRERVTASDTPSGHRRRLAHRIAQAHRRPHAHRARRRRRRGSRAGRARRGARSSGPSPGVPRQSGRLAHGRRQAPRDRLFRRTSCSSASTKSSATRSTPRADARRPISTRRWTTTWATTCCGWCSWRAIRCSRPRRASR